MRVDEKTVAGRAEALVKAWGRKAAEVAERQAYDARRQNNPHAHVHAAILQKVNDLLEEEKAARARDRARRA